MKKKIVSALMMCATLGLSAGTAVADSDDGYEQDRRGKQSVKRLAVRIHGTGDLVYKEIFDTDGDGVNERMPCFETDLYDLKSNRLIGTGEDCLGNVTPSGTGLKVDAHYTLNIWNKGTLVVRGRNTAQPVMRETVNTVTGAPFTHSVTASGDWNAVLAEHSTGRFANRTGTMRASGMMDVSQMNNNEGDPNYMDIILVIELERR